MKDTTVINKIDKWSNYLNIDTPKVKIYETGLIKGGKNIRGRYKKGTIEIYDKDREVIKHEFLHYLHDLLDKQSEESVRKKVAMSWKNIKKWFKNNHRSQL